jgi:hypothetical protein
MAHERGEDLPCVPEDQQPSLQILFIEGGGWDTNGTGDSGSGPFYRVPSGSCGLGARDI